MLYGAVEEEEEEEDEHEERTHLVDEEDDLNDDGAGLVLHVQLARRLPEQQHVAVLRADRDEPLHRVARHARRAVREAHAPHLHAAKQGARTSLQLLCIRIRIEAVREEKFE